MPIAAFRSWVGFAKAGAPTVLTAAVSAGATSLSVSNTNVPASSTVYIIDGKNSETATVSAGGGSTTLTVGALSNAHPVNTPIFWQLTASLGPANWMPVKGITFADHIVNILDQGIRGSNVATYNVTQGTMTSEIGIDGDIFPDVFGYVVGSMYGAVDFAGGTPNTHTFAAMNTAASNGQPTPLLLFVYDGFNTRLFAGAKAAEVQVKYSPNNNVEYTSKWMAFGSAVVATPTISFSTLTPQSAWQAAATINGTAVNNCLSADFTLKRTNQEGIVTLAGTQQPLIVWDGPLETTGNLMLTMEDDTNLNFYLGNTQPTVLFTLTNGTGATQVQIQLQMTKCQFTDAWQPTITGGKGYVQMGGPLNAVANTTDANTSGGGYSPSRFVLKNAVASGTYQ